MHGAGVKSDIEFEALVSYWLSWYVLPTGPEDGISLYVFPLVIRLPKGQTCTALIYLGLLFYLLDECVKI